MKIKMTGKKAITTKQITGVRIPTIPVGTLFEVLYRGVYSTCKGLPVSSVWNDEYVLIED